MEQTRGVIYPHATPPPISQKTTVYSLYSMFNPPFTASGECCSLRMELPYVFGNGQQQCGIRWWSGHLRQGVVTELGQISIHEAQIPSVTSQRVRFWPTNHPPHFWGVHWLLFSENMSEEKFAYMWSDGTHTPSLCCLRSYFKWYTQTQNRMWSLW